MSKKVIILAGVLILGLVLIVTRPEFLRIRPAEDLVQPDFLAEREEIILPEPRFQSQVSIEEAILGRRSVREYREEPLTLQEVSQLLWSAQGITDPQLGRRAAPSAGALYPLTVYLTGQIEGLAPGLYQYNPYNHSLIKVGERDLRRELMEAALGQPWVGRAPVNIIFTGNYDILARRYGERAPRYLYMEVGHAAQNVFLQAESLNLGTVVVGAFVPEKVRRALLLPAEEEPLYIMPVGRKL